MTSPLNRLARLLWLRFNAADTGRYWGMRGDPLRWALVFYLGYEEWHRITRNP